MQAVSVAVVGGGRWARALMQRLSHSRSSFRTNLGRVMRYQPPADLPRIASLQRRHGLRFVLDHYASMPADGSAPAAAWDALQALAEGGAWVKLSAPYRLPGHGASDQPPPHGDRVAGLFGPRVVWGSDWPHTSFAAGLQPGYATLAVQAGWPGLHAQAATLYA